MAADAQPDAGTGLDQARIEAAVRAYLARVGRRYLPLGIGLLFLLLIVILLPSRSPTGTAGSTGNAGLSTGRASSAGSGVGGASSSGPLAGSTTATGGGGGGGGGAVGTGAAAGGAPGATPGAATGPSGGGGSSAGGSGLDRSGAACRPGVKQVSWSNYAPPCRTVFAGNNGGATFHGVTAGTITVSYRVGNSTQDAAVYAAAGAAAPAPDPDYIADLNTYIGLFNRTFELYGRKVVLKSFQGQGDYIQEDQGQDQAQAQADAVTAHDLGAFADVTFQLKGSDPYWSGLAQEHVVAMGPLGYPQSYYQRHAPYWWSFNANGTQGADLLGNAICQRAAGLPAVYAGDALYQHQTRKFGLITPENPQYTEVAGQIQGQLAGCGVPLARKITYSIDVTSYESEAASMVAQMKAAGVTTVICFCDPIVPIFLSNSAHGENYSPEWFEPNYLDPQGRLEQQDEWSHAISDGGRYPPKSANEPYRAYQIARPGAQPAELYYDEAYFTVLQLFLGLQAAGPDLTPNTFEEGMDSLPTTPNGMLGSWHFGPGVFNPPATVQIGWWSPSTPSQRDGAAGSWQNCAGGTWFPIDPSGRSQWGPAHTQLGCFGH